MQTLPSTHVDYIKSLRGVGYFAPKNADGSYRSFIPLSPSAEAALNVESTEITYVSAESGVNEIKKRQLIEVIRSGTMVCNQMTREIYGLWLIADVQDVAQAGATVTNEDTDYVFPNSLIFLGGTANGGSGVFGISSVSVNSHAGETAGGWTAATLYAPGAVVIPTTPNTHWYMAVQVANGTSHASTEPTFPTNGGTVTDGTVTWQDMGVITYTVNNDYEIDASLGTIMILSTGAIAVAASRVPASLRLLGRTFRLRVDYTRAAKTIERVASKSSARLEGKFFFQEDNPDEGNGRWYARSATLAPNGELTLKSGQEFGAVSFNLAFQTTAAGPALQRDGVPS